MSSITITRTSECANQNHVVLEVSGDVSYTYRGDMDALTSPVTEEEKEAFIKVLMKIAKIGRTRAQIRNGLTNGYVINI